MSNTNTNAVVKNSNTKNEKENTMEKIKAEMVNEFELKDSYSHKATVTVKVKNKVFEITLKRPYHYGEYKKVTELYFNDDIQTQFAEFDIEVDYDHIKEKYEAQILIWDEEAKEKKRAKRKEEYKNNWAHNAKKVLEELDDEITLEIESEEDYLERDGWVSTIATIHYKGYKCALHYEDRASDRRYTHHTPKMKYILSTGLDNYSARSYVKPASLIKRWKELVDHAIQKAEWKKEKEDKWAKVERTLNKIEIEGCEVQVEKRYCKKHRSKRRYDYNYVQDGCKLIIKWEGGRLFTETIDAVGFTLPTKNGVVKLAQLKKYIAMVKEF